MIHARIALARRDGFQDISSLEAIMGAVVRLESQQDVFSASEDAFSGLVGTLRSPQTAEMSHDELERLLQRKGNELLRQLFQAHLELRALKEKQKPRIVGADGVPREDVRGRVRHLMTVFGEVEVNRKLYGASSVDSLAPLDAQLNLPIESFSLEVRRRAAKEVVRGSMEDAVEAICETTGASISKRQLEQLVARAAVDVDAFYALKQQRRLEEPPASPSKPALMVLSTDAKGIVMRPEGLREATRQKAEHAAPKMRTRVSPGEKPNRKRMAQAAAVYEVTPHVRTPADILLDLAPVPDDARPKVPKPQNKRVWASVEKDARTVVDEMFTEAASRDPAGSCTWVALVDGAPKQIELLQQSARDYDVDLTIIVDVIHVLEYVWSAGACFFASGTKELEDWVGGHLATLLGNGSTAVAASMRREATRKGLSKQARAAVDACARYLVNHKDTLQYGDYLAAGFPVATGVIEGTCRYLIKDRMDITGARWGLSGAEAVLRLRSVKKSGDFNAYWEFHLNQEQVRNHLNKYASSPAKPKLRVLNGGK